MVQKVYIKVSLSQFLVSLFIELLILVVMILVNKSFLVTLRMLLLNSFMPNSLLLSQVLSHTHLIPLEEDL